MGQMGGQRSCCAWQSVRVLPRARVHYPSWSLRWGVGDLVLGACAGEACRGPSASAGRTPDVFSSLRSRRRAQVAGGLHPAVRVQLPLPPYCPGAQQGDGQGEGNEGGEAQGQQGSGAAAAAAAVPAVLVVAGGSGGEGLAEQQVHVQLGAQGSTGGAAAAAAAAATVTMLVPADGGVHVQQQLEERQQQQQPSLPPPVPRAVAAAGGHPVGVIGLVQC